MPNLVSVILPIYNVSQYLRECLDSIINQTYSNLEIIAVNDGTTDDSVYILEEYSKSDKRIKIVHQKNQGLATTRNTGFKNSTGAYIYFMDTDDIIEKTLIEDALGFADKEKCDIVTFEHIEFSGKLNFGYISEKQIKDNQIYDGEDLLDHYLNIKKNNWVPIWMYVFKRDFLIQSELEFKEGGINHEDVLFTPQIILKSEKIGYLKHAYYYYRQRPNSITTCANSFRKKDHFIIANELYDTACKKNEIRHKELLLKYVVIRYEHIISQIKAQNNPNLREELLEVKKDIKHKKLLKDFITKDFKELLPKSIITNLCLKLWNILAKWPRRIYKYQIKPLFSK